MKNILIILISFIFINTCFSQSDTTYKTYTQIQSVVTELNDHESIIARLNKVNGSFTGIYDYINKETNETYIIDINNIVKNQGHYINFINNKSWYIIIIGKTENNCDLIYFTHDKAQSYNIYNVNENSFIRNDFEKVSSGSIMYEYFWNQNNGIMLVKYNYLETIICNGKCDTDYNHTEHRNTRVEFKLLKTNDGGKTFTHEKLLQINNTNVEPNNIDNKIINFRWNKIVTFNKSNYIEIRNINNTKKLISKSGGLKFELVY